MIEHLPPTGALARAIHGHNWTDLEYLIADVFDAVQMGTHQLARVQTGKSGSKPKPHPRPDEASKGTTLGDRGERSVEDVVSYLDSKRPKSKAG